MAQLVRGISWIILPFSFKAVAKIFKSGIGFHIPDWTRLSEALRTYTTRGSLWDKNVFKHLAESGPNCSSEHKERKPSK